ncbi:MAG: glycosyltransferase [Bacteroidaceae bacterium]|nr:glycosyltransferase [Bacteroidaceae bacterium]
MGEKGVLISFVVTYYNIPLPMIRECIHSIVSLNIPADSREILLIDDGSTTNPMPAMAEYAEQVTYIRQENRGLSGARNRGIESAQGKYIQFVDGDDRLIPQTYNQMIRFASEDNLDMIMMRLTHKNNPVNKSTSQQANQTSGSQYMASNNLRVSACSFLVKRELLSELRFKEGILHEDELFMPLLMLKVKSMVSLPIDAYYYRDRTTSITHRDNKDWIERRLKDKHKVILLLQQELTHLTDELERKALERRIAQLTMDYIYDTCRLTSDAKGLETRIATLKSEELFPLPREKYTRKYQLFACLSQSEAVRYLMVKIL